MMMNAEDYEALEIFIRETNRRFQKQNQAIIEFWKVVKLNRQNVENIQGDLTDIYQKLHEGGEHRNEILKLVSRNIENIQKIRQDYEDIEENIKTKMELEEVMEFEKAPSESRIAKAVQDTRQKKPDVKPQLAQSIPKKTPPAQPPKESPNDNKHTEQELRDMDFVALKKKAINKFGCKEINKSRDFYVDFILKEQEGGTDE